MALTNEHITNGHYSFGKRGSPSQSMAPPVEFGIDTRLPNNSLRNHLSDATKVSLK
jgi:hypothetical protein